VIKAATNHESKVMFDLTSANTRWLGGLDKKLKELCKAAWEEDKVSGSIPDWLPQQHLHQYCQLTIVAMVANGVTELCSLWSKTIHSTCEIGHSPPSLLFSIIS